MPRKQSTAPSSSKFSSKSASSSARPSAPARASNPVTTPKVASQSPSVAMQSQPTQGGFLARVAETATGVAVGHVVGRALTGAASMVMGNGSSTPAEESFKNDEVGCQPQLSQFLACMDRNKEGDLSACQFYMDMLSQCRTGGTTEASAAYF